MISDIDTTHQELSNPRVGPHIRAYPEDGSKRFAEAWQADRWRKEIDPTLATPMIRVDGQDFYIHEPVKMDNGEACMPIRWFFREEVQGGKAVPHYYAEAWQLQPVPCDIGAGGYVVLEYDSFVVDTHQFTLSLPKMIATFEVDHLPDPRVLLGQ